MSLNSTRCLIDANIDDISDVPFDYHTETINLHHNRLSQLGNEAFPSSLINLDLSSNLLTTFCGVKNLHNLKRLNLSANNLKDVQDFKHLSSLVHLDLSYNQLENLSDLRGDHDHPLAYLDVRGNRLSSIDELTKDLSGFKHLTDLILSDEPPTENDNPICHHTGFRAILFYELCQLQRIDYCPRGSPLKTLTTKKTVDRSLGGAPRPHMTKCSRGVQSEAEKERILEETALLTKKRNVMIQVSISKAERRKLTLHLAKMRTELRMERTLRQKSEELQKSLLTNMEQLKERCKHGDDLVEENLILKKQLGAVARSGALLEEHLCNVLNRMKSSVKAYGEEIELREECYSLYTDLLCRTESDAMIRESTLKESLERVEERMKAMTRARATMRNRIAQMCEKARRQADEQLEVARLRYSQLEAEFRMALECEDQRYNQASERVVNAEKRLREQNVKLRAAKKNLTMAGKIIVDQRKELLSTGRELANAKDLLGKMNETIKKLGDQLGMERMLRLRILDKHKECLARGGDDKDEVEQLRGQISTNNIALRSELSELADKVKTLEEGLQIKKIQVDDQVETITHLKAELAAERAREKEYEKVEKENVHLQATVKRLTKGTRELETLVLDLQNENASLKEGLRDHQDRLAGVEEDILRKEDDWSRRCSLADKQRDEALIKMRDMSERLQTLTEDYRERVERAERAVREQTKVANERILETEELANQRIREVEEEMRQLLHETVNSRARVERTLMQLIDEVCQRQE